MLRNRIKELALGGGLAAAALLLAPQAHASPWCPTASDNKITCNNCSRELTCDVTGVGLYILGNGVTLDGKMRNLYYPPFHGIEVKGTAAIIKNIRIANPAGNGIEFNSRTAGGTANWVDHSYVVNSNQYGISNESVNQVVITYAGIHYSRSAGVISWGTKATDLRNSQVTMGSDVGYWGESGNYPLILNNNIYSNVIGLIGNNVAGMTIYGNSLDGNLYYGLFLNNAGGTVRYNRGSGTSIYYDCYEAHNPGTSIVGSSNVWGTKYGSGCGP